MFRDIIQYKIIEDIPQDMRPNIHIRSNNNRAIDVTLTLILMMSNIESKSHIEIDTFYFGLPTDEFTFKECVHTNLGQSDLKIVAIPEETYEFRDKEITEYLPKIKYVENKSLNIYFKQQGIVARVYTNIERGETYLITDGAYVSSGTYPNDLLANSIASVLPILMPWLLDGNELSDMAKQLLISFNNKDSKEYLRIAGSFISGLNLKGYKLDKYLKDFETYLDREQLNKYGNSIQDYNRTIKNLTSQLVSTYDMLEKAVAIHASYEEKIRTHQAGPSKLREFFETCKSIDLIKSSGSELTWAIRGYLDNYDIDMYETMRSRKTSVLYDKHLYEDVSEEMALKILDAIFLEQSVRVKMGACVSVNFAQGHYTSQSISDISFLVNRMPNIHLKYYNCFGGNGRQINECIARRDYTGAVSQTVSVVGSLNLAETNNVINFMNELFNPYSKKIPWFSIPDNEDATIEDVIKFLGGKDE